MKKKKTLILLIITIVIICFIIIISISSSKEEKYQKRIVKTCENLTKDIKDKKDFLLFIQPSDSSNDSLDTIDRIKENYPKTLIYQINYNDIKDNCIKKILEKSSLYEDIQNNPVPTSIVYKSGEYVAQIAGLDEYRETEKFFEKNKIIEIKEIKESITYNEYKEKQKQEDYLLLVMSDEKMRDDLDKLLKENFSNYSYNIINMYSDEGKKIKEDIESNNDIIKEYPRMFYFKNKKLILSEDAFDDFTIKEYKEKLNKTK